MENNDLLIEGSTATWKMPRLESELGGTYSGVFQFKCFLNPMELLQAGRDYRSYLGSLAQLASDSESNLAFALSQLQQRIIKAPPFWTSAGQEPNSVAGNIGDMAIVSAVLDAAIRAEVAFKEKISKEREEILERSIVKAEALLQKAKE